eukprot:31316-Pelagococcus_subviridis.AAC.35
MPPGGRAAVVHSSSFCSGRIRVDQRQNVRTSERQPRGDRPDERAVVAAQKLEVPHHDPHPPRRPGRHRVHEQHADHAQYDREVDPDEMRRFSARLLDGLVPPADRERGAGERVLRAAEEPLSRRRRAGCAFVLDDRRERARRVVELAPRLSATSALRLLVLCRRAHGS